MELLVEFWNALGAFHEFLLALLLSLATAALLSLFRPKVKLIWGSTSVNFHRFKLVDDGQPINITTEKLFVQNVGKKAATNIELVLSDEPTSYTLWSPREHRRGPLDGGGYSIKIETLAPQELLIVDTVDVHNRNPRLLAVNCPEALSRQVNFMAQRKFGMPVYAFIAYLMFAGFVGSFYALLRIVFGS